MTRPARTWCLRYAAILALVTTLPYLIAFAVAGPEWDFTGFLFGVEDGNSYIAKMLLGASGEWLFRTPYTAFPQRGALVFLPYLLLGKLASGQALHLQLVVLFHLARVAAIPLLVVSLYRFTGVFLEEERWRRWVVAMATIGGGLGWALILAGQEDWLGSLPLDLHSPEAFGFLAIYGLPHLILARAALLWGLTEYLRSDTDVRRSWRAGALWLVMGLFQPLAVVTVLAILGMHLAMLGVLTFRSDGLSAVRHWGARALRAAVIAAPVVLYNAFAFLGDPYLRAWTEQNRILSPHPAHYLIAYGLVLAPAVWGGWATLRSGNRGRWLVVAWALALPFLAYAPHNLQRRLPEGVFVALAILAAMGMARWTGAGRLARWLSPGLLGASGVSTVLLLAGGTRAAMQPAAPVFRPAAEVAAFEALAEAASPGSVVLASYATGNPLPAWAPVRVVIGHGPESVGLAELEPEVARVYAATTPDAERAGFFAQHAVRFVFWGPYERALGTWNPDDTGERSILYDHDGYVLFAVRDS